MDFLAFLALPAFVFALSAISTSSNLKKRVDQLEEELSEFKGDKA